MRILLLVLLSYSNFAFGILAIGVESSRWPIQVLDSQESYPVQFPPDQHENTYAVHTSVMPESICIKKDGLYIISYSVGWHTVMPHTAQRINLTAHILVNEFVPVETSYSETFIIGGVTAYNQQIFSVHLRNSDCISLHVTSPNLPYDQLIRITPGTANLTLEK